MPRSEVDHSGSKKWKAAELFRFLCCFSYRSMRLSLQPMAYKITIVNAISWIGSTFRRSFWLQVGFFMRSGASCLSILWDWTCFISGSVNHLLLVVNSSVNFLIYCCMAKRFRSALINLFRSRKCFKSRKNRPLLFQFSPNEDIARNDLK